MKRRDLIAFASVAAMLAAMPAARAAAADEAAIRQVLLAQFDKPEARLAVAPVVVRGTHALAGWTQGQRGGRALLRRQGGAGGTWQIVLCGGDGLKSEAALREAGLPAADAAALSREQAAAEALLPPARRQLLSTFDGLVRMDAHGHHPAGHKP